MKHIFLTLLTLLLLLTGCERNTSTSDGGYAAAQTAIGRGVPIMLEVGADYCTACQEMKGMIDELKTIHPDLAVYMVNANKNRAAAESLGIRMIPTQIFYDASGQEVYRHVGGYGKAEFSAVLQQYQILKEQ